MDRAEESGTKNVEDEQSEILSLFNYLSSLLEIREWNTLSLTAFGPAYRFKMTTLLFVSRNH